MHGCVECVCVCVCVCVRAYMLCEACCWPSKQTGVRSYQCLAPVARWKPGGEKGESPGPHWGNKTARLSLPSPKRTHTLMGAHLQTHTRTQFVAEIENKRRRNRRDRKKSYMQKSNGERVQTEGGFLTGFGTHAHMHTHTHTHTHTH